MTVHPPLPGSPADPPSADERLLVADLRLRLRAAMTEIPPDLDTDLNLTRWIRGYHGNLDGIVKNFPIYVQSRSAAGFSSLGHPHSESFFQLDHIRPFLPFIASSRLSDRVWHEERNCFLFVERGWSQPKEIVKVMKTSDYLLHCFGYSEHLLQLILHRERHQAPHRGPVQFIVLFDLTTVNVMDYLNPLAAHMKLWKLRSDLWQDWYPDMVQRIYLVNPPRVAAILWRLAKLFLTERNCRLVEIPASHADVLRQLPTWFVPREFGGDFVNNHETGDESGVSRRRQITADDHYRLGAHYERRGVQRGPTRVQEIKAGEKSAVNVVVQEGGTLLWDFTVSGEVDFAVVRAADARLVYPQLRVVTSKLGEEGELEGLEEGEYRLEWANTGGYFNVKLEVAVTVC